MRLKVTIIRQRKNPDGIDFYVRDSEGREWLIVNCLIKDMCYGTQYTCYLGSLGKTIYGYNEGHPVHLNQISAKDWILLIE